MNLSMFNPSRLTSLISFCITVCFMASYAVAGSLGISPGIDCREHLREPSKAVLLPLELCPPQGDLDGGVLVTAHHADGCVLPSAKSRVEARLVPPRAVMKLSL